MITIRLLDARRGLNLKCRELFKDEKIAEGIYRFLCDGIEECEDAEPERKGRWIDKDGGLATCSECGDRWGVWSVMNFCPNCGCAMTEGAEDDKG